MILIIVSWLCFSYTVQGSILDHHVWKDRFYRSIPLSHHTDTLNGHHPEERFDACSDVTLMTKKRVGAVHVHLGSHPEWSSLGWPNENNRTKGSSINTQESGTVSVTLDLPAFFRLLFLVCSSAASISTAFMGTLRLLAPMIFARRLLVFMGDIINDYMTGRYFRTTYTRLERTYLLYYEAPSAFRALCRISAQITIYFLLSSIMAWFVGIRHPPCHGANGALASFCALLWISTVVGTGHAFSTAISIWGGPIRIQAKLHTHRPKTSLNNLLIRPWRVIHWMKNPEAFINMMATPQVKPFDPKPETYPITWISFRLLLIYAVAKVASTDPSNCVWCLKESKAIGKLMNSYFCQLALCDEWYRVFVIEKRIGLGVSVISAAFFAKIFLIYISLKINPNTTVLMIPSFLALLVSGLMNVATYWGLFDLKTRKRKR